VQIIAVIYSVMSDALRLQRSSK